MNARYRPQLIELIALCIIYFINFLDDICVNKNQNRINVIEFAGKRKKQEL